jgi:Xaa-Pro aminopeptidase
MTKLDALKQVVFEKKGFNGFAVFNWANMLYLSGVPGAVAMLIPRDGEGTIYVYGVNYEQVKAESKGFNVELVKRDESLLAKFLGNAKRSKIKKLAVDTLSVEAWHTLVKEAGGKMTLKINRKLMWELRKVKTAEELALLRKAGELTSEGMKAACEALKPGMKEYEVAAEVEYAMRKRGSYGTAFETIVASGACSAFPHGGCGDRVIRGGDLVVVDVGATYKFYRSDMTRTLVAGKPSEKQQRLYGVVQAAHYKAFEAMRANAKARDVDGVARKIIAEAGYGECFVHGLGHGVGLEVHEPPTLNPTSKDVLAAGNVVTDEPGIYVVGYGGVRVEDTVLVQENGAEKLTSGTYGLNAE